MKIFASQFRQRAERHQAFYSRCDEGDLIIHVNPCNYPSLESFLCRKLHEMGLDTILARGGAEKIVQEYLKQMGEALAQFYATDDDSVPCAPVYCGVGSITAAMTGMEPVHDGTTSWLEPNLSWPEIERLAFNPANKWIEFACDVNRAIWNGWDGSFAVLPYLHRSPLDAANGIRGTDLFLDIYEEPDRVHALIDWCADWSIKIEQYLKAEASRPVGCGVGIWGTWLPDDAVFVNGDPVGLINREQGEIFDRPSVEKLFTHTGGGFFHNHTIGLHQVDLVSSYRGILVQWFVNDPRQPSLEEALLDNPALREKILAASLQCPIGGWVSPERLDSLLDIVKHGRFILSTWVPKGEAPDAILRKVRKASRLR